MVATMRAHVERANEAFADVDVPELITLFPGVSRNLELYSLGCARLPFLFEPGHSCHMVTKRTICDRSFTDASPAELTYCPSSASPDCRDSQATRSAIPTPIEHESRKDPPYEKNGSGMPVIGIRLIVMPTFSTMCVKKRPAMPKTHRLENGSVARRATRSNPKRSHANRHSATSTPTNPSSSPTTEKMKSVCCAGRKASRFCVSSVEPFPSRPPE